MSVLVELNLVSASACCKVFIDGKPRSSPPPVRTAEASFLRQLDYSLRGGCNVPNEDPPCERDSPGLIMR